MEFQEPLLNGRGDPALCHPIAVAQVFVFCVAVEQGINRYITQNTLEALSGLWCVGAQGGMKLLTEKFAITP